MNAYELADELTKMFRGEEYDRLVHEIPDMLRQKQNEIEDLKNANRFIQNFAEEQHQRAVALEMRELTDEEMKDLIQEYWGDVHIVDPDGYLHEIAFIRAILRKASEKCNHSNFVKTEHLTGEGAMEYVEWFDNTCLDCGEHWTTNN